MNQIRKIKVPVPFDFSLALLYLSRSPLECMHVVHEQVVRKLILIGDGTYIIEVRKPATEYLLIEILWHETTMVNWSSIINFVREWFDLETNLEDAYKVLNKSDILSPLLKKLKGLRIVGIPDLFEVICWAIIGQQINLTFAYQVKKSFVTQYGKCIENNGDLFYSFPTPKEVLKIAPETWKRMKFSRQKARYIQLAAEKIQSGELSKNILLELNPSLIRTELLKLVGIGAWSADYILMRCFHIGWAYPRADAGLHQALKLARSLDRKPTTEELDALSKQWHPWQAYATFYLWRSLH